MNDDTLREPDEAAVETLARALHTTANDGTDWDKLTDPSGWYERAHALIRDHGVEVSTEGFDAGEQAERDDEVIPNPYRGETP